MYDLADIVVVAMQVILDAIFSVAQGLRINGRSRMLSLKAFMGDMTMAVQTEDHARAVLFRLNMGILCVKELKPNNSKSVERKGQSMVALFSVGDQMI